MYFICNAKNIPHLHNYNYSFYSDITAWLCFYLQLNGKTEQHQWMSGCIKLIKNIELYLLSGHVFAYSKQVEMDFLSIITIKTWYD